MSDSEGSNSVDRNSEEEDVAILRELINSKKKQRQALWKLQVDTEDWRTRSKELDETLKMLHEQMGHLQVEQQAARAWQEPCAPEPPTPIKPCGVVSPDAATRKSTFKIPTGLPPFKPDQLSLFLREMESLLEAHCVPRPSWTKVLATSFKGADLDWFLSNVVQEQLDWPSTKERLYEEFVGHSARLVAQRQLRSMKQGRVPAAKFFRQLEFYAKEAAQPLDSAFAHDILQHALHPSLAQQTRLLLGVDGYEALTFSSLKRAAKHADDFASFASSPPRAPSKTTVTAPTDGKSQGPSTCDHCGKRGHTAASCARRTGGCFRCGSTDHRLAECPEAAAPLQNKQTLLPAAVETQPAASSGDIDPGDDDLLILQHVHEAGQASTRAHLISVPCTVNANKATLWVDTLAEISSLSPEFVQSLNLVPSPAHGSYIGANNTTIPRGGTVVVQEFCCGDRSFDHVTFDVLEQVAPCVGILGMDLFNKLGFSIHGLPSTYPPAVDLDSTLTRPPSSILQTADSRLVSPLPEPERQRIFSCLQPELEANSALPATGGCTHPCATVRLALPDDVVPVYVPQYRISDARLPHVDAQLQVWLDEGVVVPSSAGVRWNSPILAAHTEADRTKGKAPRICIDPRSINRHLPDDPRPLPRIDDIYRQLQGFSIISELDLVKSFTQIPLHEDSQAVTTFTWKRRRYKFARCPFGLKPLSQRFQEIMETVLDEHLDYVLIFVDNVYVYTLSDNPEDHATRVSAVVRTLTAASLRINFKKSFIGYKTISVLGHLLSAHTRAPDPAKLAVLKDWVRPTTGKQMESYLGFINYLRSYIPCYARLTAVFEALRHHKSFPWNPTLEQHFCAVAAVLEHAPVLQDPLPQAPLHLSVDASQDGLGLALWQWQDDNHRTRRYIWFAAQALRGAQRHYPATKRELLAIVWAIRKAHDYVWGRHFFLHTDHGALTFLYSQKHTNHMILNWMDILFDYHFDVVHCPGVLNVLPDCLSRMYPTSAPATSPSAPLVSQLVMSSTTVRDLASFIRERHDKLLPSPEEQSTLLTDHHTFGHFGPDTLFTSIWKAGYFWPTMRQDCITCVGRCPQCLAHNIGKYGYHPQRTLLATQPFEHLAIDLKTDLPVSESGSVYLLVVTCLMTKYKLLLPLPDKTASTIAKTLWQRVFTVFPVPKILQSDNGTEFVNSVLDQLTHVLGIDKRRITAYNPRANGSAENTVKSAVHVLKKLVQDDWSHWDDYIPLVQLTLNTKPHSTLKTSPGALLFSVDLAGFADYSASSPSATTLQHLQERAAFINELLRPSAIQSYALQRQRQKQAHDARARTVPPITVGTEVMFLDKTRHSKLLPRWKGPYRVVRQDRNGAYTLQDPTTSALLLRKCPRHHLKLLADSSAPDTFEVERVLQHRFVEGELQYLIKWKYYAEEDNTWEPVSNLSGCQSLIDSYHNVIPLHSPPP